MSIGNFESNGKVIVGVDGTRASINALSWAAKFAQATNQKLKVISTWSSDSVTSRLSAFGEVPPHDDSIMEREDHALEAIANSMKEVFFANNVPSWVSTEAIDGNPAEVLVSESRTASLLVVGTRGHGHLADMVLGSVSSDCVARAHCPVTVVRNDSAV